MLTVIYVVVVFPTYEAPHYRYGYQILILFGGLAIAGATLLWYMWRRKAYVICRVPDSQVCYSLVHLLTQAMDSQKTASRLDSEAQTDIKASEMVLGEKN